MLTAWPEADGDGDLDIIPEAILGLPIERRTVSNVRSIFLSERVSSSCFLGLDFSVDDTQSSISTTDLLGRPLPSI